MTHSEFRALLDTIQEAERHVCEAGQKEYGHGADDNCFANFDRVASYLNITREQALMTYALKHLDGIVAYIKGHRSQREDVRGRIKDLRLYLALLHGMVDEAEAKGA